LIYNNLLYFLVVILIFSTDSIPDSPQLPLYYALPIFLVKAFLYHRWALHAHSSRRIHRDVQYFASEQKFSILAVILFTIDVYLLDCKYYIALLPFSDHLPAIINLGGLSLFFFYLCIMWGAARKSYHTIFVDTPHRSYTTLSFLLFNIKTNLPIVLPWLLVSLLLDILNLIHFPLFLQLPPYLRGEPLVFLVFILFLATTFPALVRRLWNCTPLPAGPSRRLIEEFFRKQKFTAEILLWPLFEGRVLTAGVMGISKRFRYLLITPALLDTLDHAELEAVLAHEIGHTKRYHLQLYLVLFLGFGLLLSAIANPILYLVLNTNLFYQLITITNEDPNSVLAFWSTLPLFFLMIIYFRFVFGFFMRNFERQADLYVFKSIGDSAPLIRSFEKIGKITGTRNKPSWHHFGIGQRIDFLEKCERNRNMIKNHHIKVYASLLLYVIILVGGAGYLHSMPMELFDSHTEAKFAEAVLKQRARQEPDNAFWYRLLGDLYQDREMDTEAISAYAKAMELDPTNPDIMNNFAWLLIMTDDLQLRDPAQSLSLALSAAELSNSGYILDTLATAYWANGSLEKAVATERKAVINDPVNRHYYEAQIEKFLNMQYD